MLQKKKKNFEYRFGRRKIKEVVTFLFHLIVFASSFIMGFWTPLVLRLVLLLLMLRSHEFNLNLEVVFI